MMSFEPSDGAGEGGFSLNASISIRIVRTDEQTSLMMQRFTAYVIEVSDFGQTKEVAHRYGDFETLHNSVRAECIGVTLPSMPPKGVDGTDMAVVAKRKVDLEKMLRFMLGCPDVLLEKQLHLWKFLELPNPAVIAARFVLVPRSRLSNLKTIVKLTEAKYKDDVFRLAHPTVSDLLMEALREFRNGQPDSGHWCRQPEGRGNVCKLLAGALGTSEIGRARLIDADVIGMLLGIVEREESALDDARTALNVVVAREAERFATLLATFLCRGGMAQLYVLAQRTKCQEFVAKLLWLAWDAPTRAPFAQPGGQGLRLLQALLRSSVPACALLGAVLLAGMVANGDLGSDASHRSEALKMIRSVLENPEAASDPQFTKTLCGANAALVRLAGMIEDADLAPLILGLLCAAKPPAAKLGRISGNLASMVANRDTGGHSEQTRARAAELLLHIQGSAPAPGQGPVTAPGASTVDLERCEGLAEHEESLEKAMRWQLDEALGKSRQDLERTAGSVQAVASMGSHRLQAVPHMDFTAFDSTMTAYKNSRQALETLVQDSQSLHHDMERQLLELKTAKPSTDNEHTYKERLVNAERLYMEVKAQRETLATATSEASQKQATAEASSAALKRATDEVRRSDDEIGNLRLKKAEKETEATKLRHKATTPNLQQMKEQAEASLERNAAQAKELQVIGQRVNQGDPDYLKAGETREQKIAELAAKLTQLKKQHQQLLLQQKEYDFDPAALTNKADAMTNEAMGMQNEIMAIETRRMDADRVRSEKTGQSSRDLQEAQSAQERRTSLSSRLQLAESQVRSEMSALQPLIQEHHSGWQKLLGQQKKLDSDNFTLVKRLSDATTAGEREAQTRIDLALRLQGLVTSLQSFQLFLDELNQAPAGGYTAPAAASANVFAAAPTSAAAAGLFGEDDDDILASPVAKAPAAAPAAPTNVFADDDDDFGMGAPPPQLVSAPAPAAASAAPSLVAAPASAEATPLMANIVDDFDAFLKEDIGATFAAPAESSAALTVDPFEDDVLGGGDDITFAAGAPAAAPAAEPDRSAAPALEVAAVAAPAPTLSPNDDIFDDF